MQRDRGICDRCQVWPFRGQKKQLWPFFKLVGFEIFENLLLSWPLLKSIEVYIVKSKIFSFPKTEFGIFQLQAPGNPGLYGQPAKMARVQTFPELSRQ